MAFQRQDHQGVIQQEAVAMDTENLFTIDQLLDGLGPILFESIRIPFGIFDQRHRVLWANAALAELHHLSAKELIGNVCYEVCRGRTAPCDDCQIQTVFQTGKTRIQEQWFHFPGRSKVWGEVHYYPVRGNEGNVAAVIVFGFDVTDKNNRIEILQNYSKYLADKLDGNRKKKQKILLPDGETTLTVKLSGRESEVLGLLTEGYTNIQIGALLSISNNTVKTHVNSIFNKLGVNDRTQAAVIATRQNLV